MKAVQVYCYLVAALCLSSICVCNKTAVGAWKDIDPNREDVQSAANFGLQKYNEQSNDVYLYKIMKITSARSQVVSGVNYALSLDIGKTLCRKNNSSGYGHGQSCVEGNSEVTQVYTCTFVVYIIPWNEINNRLVSSSCALQ